MNDSILGSRHGDAPVPLSVLDFAIAGKGKTAQEALDGSIELAKLADQRGFARYWLAEHHAMPSVTTSSPAMVLARIVGETRRVRLGSGGMMLPNFPPLVIAEQFGLLEAFAPGRIDLGVGRAPGTNGATAAALRRGHIGAEDYPSQLTELLGFLDDSFPEDHRFHESVYAVPGPRQAKENGVTESQTRPPVWILGSSGYSAQVAAQLGYPFAFAAHLADQNLEQALEIYRKSFTPSEVLDRPYVIASMGVMAADTEEEGHRQSWAYSHAMMRMSLGKSFVVPTPEDAASYSYSLRERQIIEMWDAKTMSGTGPQVVDHLNSWQKWVEADEIMMLNLGYSPEAILRSTALIADAYNMPTDLDA